MQTALTTPPAISAWAFDTPEDRLRRREQPRFTRLGRVGGGGSKVTEEYVRCIRAWHADGKTVTEIANHFTKLGRNAIYEIVKGHTWRHVH